MTGFIEGHVFENDADLNPFAQSLDGVWHKRPASDPWIASMESPNCRTVCGLAIHSVCTSEYEPEADPSTGSTLCQCVTAKPPMEPGPAGYRYTITATGPDGKPLPGAVITFSDDLDDYVNALLATGPEFARAYYRRSAAEPPPLCIDGREYHRRHLARKRRKR